ncbi:outer membrane autotransporter protein [Phyllobacterium myrsinacearum]|uniref:autotransporter domain-containing protein n=1 Tax=Phyllobacterium myrsinacearum TaxID=28101 RepID=UPI0010EB1B4C|nr:autotransporter domain-containing protein [Phyllobacterium myrsinacearum]RZS89012.1 outer membrane autotransporter protein [Phyllobacterium myrsinacearum]
MPRSNGPEGLAPHRQVCGARPALWAGLLFFVCLAVFWPALSQAQTAPVANPARVTVDYGSTANSVTLSIGGGAPTSVAVAGAAAHGTASASGTSITYTPVRGYAGPDSFTYTATNLDGTSAPATVDVTVSTPSLTITPSSPHSARVGTPYTQTYTFSGGQEPYGGFFISGIPSGLSITALTANSVTISGVPQLQGSYSITVSATDSSTGDGPFRTGQLFTLTVSQLTVTLSPAGPTLPYASSGSGYSQTFSASGGTAPYTFSLAGGSFPAGITLNAATGVLSGTPTVSGTFPFSVRATDSSTGPGTPFSATNNYSLVVNAPPAITLAPSTLSSGKSGVSSSQTLTATGGTAPCTFAITSGALPNGMTLSSAGVLSGAPTAAGAFNFTVTATDILGNNGAQAYTLVINQAVPVAVADAAATLANQAVTIPVIANDGGPITSIAVTSAPLHGTVAVNGLNAVYTPAQNFFGTDTFTYSATGPGGTSAPATVTITVSPLAVPVAAAHSAATMAGHATTIDTTDGATGGPFTGAAIVAPPAFGSATVSGTTITYTPPADASGAVSISYTLSNAFGTSPPAMITLTVNPLPVAAAHSVTTRAGTPVTVNLTDGATGGPFTGAAIVTPPAFGSATVSGTTITYTPPADASGAVSISYTLSNAFGTSPPAMITLTVNPLPVAAAHSVTTRAGTPVTVNLTEGATGGPFTAATMVSLSPSGSGTANIRDSGDGGNRAFQLDFAPAATFSGVATVSYTLGNAFTTSAPANVTITVTARADPSRDAEVIGIVNAQAEGARRFADAQLSNYSDRLRQLRRGGGNESSQGISLNTPRSDEQAKDRRDPADATPLGFFTEPRRTRPAEPFNKVVAEKPVPSRFGVWTAGQVEFGDTSGKSAGSGRDFTTSGVSAGLDYRFNERLTAGIGLGYGRDRTDIGRNGTRSQGESWSIGTYASWRPVKNTYLEAVLGYGALSFDSRRYLTDGGGFAYGSRDGQQVFGSVKAGYEISRDALYFTPYAGIDASWTKLDAFNERDGGSSSLRFGNQSVNSLVAIVGFETDYTYRFTGYTFTPSLKAEWRYDMANAGDIDLSYIDWSGGPLFSLKGDGSVRNAVRLGVGFDVVLDQGLNLGLAYNTTLGEGGAIRHGFNAKAGLRF